MKFLLFNVAVAAALVFLFTADRGDVQKIAGQVHDAANDMKAYANKALQKIEAKPEPAEVRSRHPAQPVQPAKLSKPPVAHPAPAPEPPLSPQLARNLPPMPEIEEGSIVAAPADLDPAVAKRRQEVLEGIDTAAAPALKEGTRLMTRSERRRELLSLAEEMELLYARSISQ